MKTEEKIRNMYEIHDLLDRVVKRQKSLDDYMAIVTKILGDIRDDIAYLEKFRKNIAKGLVVLENNEF